MKLRVAAIRAEEKFKNYLRSSSNYRGYEYECLRDPKAARLRAVRNRLFKELAHADDQFRSLLERSKHEALSN